MKEREVTVIYPIAKTKSLFWVDPETGETTKPRLSPKKGIPFEIFYELIYIKNLLKNKNLKIKIVLLDIDEYRLLNGWSDDRKKGSTRKDRIAKEIIEEIDINTLCDYKKLLPEGLSEIFTAKELMKCAKASSKLTSRAIKVLIQTETIKNIGKKGRAFLYKISE